eukprot:900424-Pyramimonas_sp.AAC.1
METRPARRSSKSGQHSAVMRVKKRSRSSTQSSSRTRCMGERGISRGKIEIATQAVLDKAGDDPLAAVKLVVST